MDGFDDVGDGVELADLEGLWHWLRESSGGGILYDVCARWRRSVLGGFVVAGVVAL